MRSKDNKSYERGNMETVVGFACNKESKNRKKEKCDKEKRGR